MKTNTWGILLIVLAIVVGGLYVASRTGAPEKTGVIKIGLILPLTGDLAFIGEAGKNAAELALEEVNADASNTHQYELVIEDDGFDAKRTAGAISKLVSIDKVDVVVSVSTGGGNVVAPIAEENELPHIGLASDVNVAKGKYNFIHWTRPQEEVDVMLAELKRRGLTKVVIMGANDSGFPAITNDLVAKAPGAGIEIVRNVEFLPGITDFKTLIAEAKTANPDAYILNAFSPELEILGKQMQDLGVEAPVTSIESFGLSNNPGIFEGEWFVDSAITTGGFNDAYRAKLNKEPGPTSGNIYDAVHLLVRAVEATEKESPTGAEVVEKLNKTEGYSGAFGPLTLGSEGEFISTPSVKVIKDGKPVLP